MLIGRILYKNKIYSVVFDREENMVYQVFSDISEVLESIDREIDISSEGFSIDQVKILTPVEPLKIVGIGRNYAGHVKELGSEMPEFPVVFFKPSSCLIPHEGIVKLPKLSNQVEYEGELALVIRRKMKNVRAEEIRKNPQEYFGYTAFLDMTARDIQKTDDVWAKAKAFDTFGPFGPWINIDPLPESLTIKTYQNNEIRQDDNIDNMIFSSDIIIEYISKHMTLETGDVVITGTPEGVGKVKAKDVINLEIETLEALEITIEEE